MKNIFLIILSIISVFGLWLLWLSITFATSFNSVSLSYRLKRTQTIPQIWTISIVVIIILCALGPWIYLDLTE